MQHMNRIIRKFDLFIGDLVTVCVDDIGVDVLKSLAYIYHFQFLDFKSLRSYHNHNKVDCFEMNP